MGNLSSNCRRSILDAMFSYYHDRLEVIVFDWKAINDLVSGTTISVETGAHFQSLLKIICDKKANDMIENVVNFHIEEYPSMKFTVTRPTTRKMICLCDGDIWKEMLFDLLKQIRYTK